MTKLPQGWVECELKDISEYKKGKKPKVLYNEQNNNLLPYIDIKCFEKKIIENYANQSDGILIDDSYILIVWDGARAGFCGESLDKGILGSTLMALKVINMNKNFVSYFIKSKYQILNKKTKGTGIPHINPEYFWKLKICVPPLNEQKRIVEKIEKEFENIDNGIEYLSKTKEQIKQYCQSVLKSAFEGKLYKKNIWKSVKLEDVIGKDKHSLKRGPFGSSLKKEFFQMSGIRVFEQYNPINNDPHWSRYYISNEKYKELKSFTAQAGDLLISCSGTLGKILELPQGTEKGIINQALLKITLNRNLILNRFFLYLFSSPLIQRKILDKTIGTAIQNIASVKELKKTEFLLPPLNEQQKIIEEIEKRFKIADEIEKIVDDGLEKAKQLKQSILKKAFEGRLVPQDPADEPASKLLERIKQERKINEQIQ